MESKIPTLKIDKEFKSLIRPLRRQEYLQLEANILADGCREAIITWNGYIVDGHNRYEICVKHQIPFDVREMEFGCREAVIAWICANQLGRRNISEETRKFLIGMQYESEKLVAGRKKANSKPIIEPDDDVLPQEEIHPSRHITAQRIAKENNIAFGTVQKYAIYTRALETIGQKDPDFVPKILSGRYKISHNNIIEISKLSPEEIKKIDQQLERKHQPVLRFNKARVVIQDNLSADQSPAQPSVKDMPAFDPDATITELTLTAPSWISSVKRTKANTDFSIATTNAKQKLARVLTELNGIVTELLDVIKEEE